MPPTPVIEPFLQDFLDSLPNVGPTDLGYETVRSHEEQMVHLNLPEVLEEEKSIPSRDGSKSISLTITRPAGSQNTVLPVILFLHGGGFVLCGKTTHKATRYELTVRANAVVVFVNYTRSPEVHHPVALEECYDALEWITKNGASIDVDPNSIVVAGDSVGGTLATVLAILDKKRGLNAVKHQVLYFPVTDYKLDTESCHQFAEGYFLYRKLMAWLWDLYIPNIKERTAITASPIYATEEDLKGVAPAFIITAEADILRDEGEAYARKLIAAGVPVYATRVLGMIHGVFNIDRMSPLAISVINQTADILNRVWGRKYASHY